MSALTDAKSGLKTRLKTITAVKEVFIQPVDTQQLTELPCFVILTEPIDYRVAIGGSHFRGRLRAKLILRKLGADEAYGDIDEFVDPSGTNSVMAAIEGDDTLDGKVDQAALVVCENIGAQEIHGVRYNAADFLVEWIRTG